MPGVWVCGCAASRAPAPDFAGGRPGWDRVAGAALFADARLDPARAQLRVELGGGVAAVGPDLARRQPAAEQLIDEREQVRPFVLVARPDPQRKRGARGVDG